MLSERYGLGRWSRSSHEERGLKYQARRRDNQIRARRSSHEERGLKFDGGPAKVADEAVAPRMRSVD